MKLVSLVSLGECSGLSDLGVVGRLRGGISVLMRKLVKGKNGERNNDNADNEPK